MRPDVAGLLSEAPAIALEQIGDADLQARVDRKYLVRLDQLATLADRLCTAHAVLSIGGLRSFAYRSVYFDTADLSCYRAHRQDRRLRWKARSRLYRDSGLCRFEVKLKTGRGDTDKRAVSISPAEAGHLPEPGRQLLERLLAERYAVTAPLPLVPTLTVEHLRSTLVAADRTGRLTLDSRLVLRGPSGRTGELGAGMVLLETKSRDGRSPADRLLRDEGVRPVSISKYGCGIALTRPDEQDQPWRPLLRQHFTPHPHAAAAA